jgi:hypothetical protein
MRKKRWRLKEEMRNSVRCFRGTKSFEDRNVPIGADKQNFSKNFICVGRENTGEIRKWRQSTDFFSRTS